MNENTLKGSIKQATGTAQKEFGKLTGNTGHQVKGAVKEQLGKAQKDLGKYQDRKAQEAESDSDL